MKVAFQPICGISVFFLTILPSALSISFSFFDVANGYVKRQPPALTLSTLVKPPAGGVPVSSFKFSKKEREGFAGLIFFL